MYGYKKTGSMPFFFGTEKDKNISHNTHTMHDNHALYLIISIYMSLNVRGVSTYEDYRFPGRPGSCVCQKCH